MNFVVIHIIIDCLLQENLHLILSSLIIYLSNITPSRDRVISYRYYHVHFYFSKKIIWERKICLFSSVRFAIVSFLFRSVPSTCVRFLSPHWRLSPPSQVPKHTHITTTERVGSADEESILTLSA